MPLHMRFLPLKEGALPGWGTQLQGHFAFRRQSAAVVANGPEWAALKKHRLWNDQPTAEPAFARGPEQGSSGKGDKHRCCRIELHHLALGPQSDRCADGAGEGDTRQKHAHVTRL